MADLAYMVDETKDGFDKWWMITGYGERHTSKFVNATC